MAQSRSETSYSYLDTFKKLVFGIAKTPSPSSQTQANSMGSEKKESNSDAPSSTTTAVVKPSDFNKQGNTAIDDLLPVPLHTLILSYLVFDVPEIHQVKLTCTKAAFLSYLTELYAKGITHNLLFHVYMNETLTWAKEYQSYLTEVVTLKNPNGQTIEAKPLQVLAAEGERNPRELKAGETNYGLVEDFKGCLDAKEAQKQSDDWYHDPNFEAATEETMKPYLKALETLCQDLIDCKNIPEDPTDEEFQRLVRELPCAIKFRNGYKPDPEHKVKGGLAYDLKILDKSDAIWIKRVKELGDWGSTKSNLYGTIAERAMQGCSPRTDHGVFHAGIGHVGKKDGVIPKKRLDYSNGVPVELKDDAYGEFGEGFCFSFFGTKARCPRVDSVARRPRSNLMSSKNGSRGIKSHQ